MDSIKEENPIPKLEISLQSERKVWNNIFAQGFISLSEKYVIFGKNISIKENENLNNPYIAQYCNPKCRKNIFL